MSEVRKLSFKTSGFSREDWQTLKSLSSPHKIQDFINKLTFNTEKGGETNMSVSEVLRTRKAHCFEGALLAATACWMQGRTPLIMDLVSARPDFDHVVALFKEDGCWGAFSKTNHSVLRYREPVYKTIRELAVSYFHEYFLNDGKKTLRTFSKPFDLSKLGTYWLTSDKNLIDIVRKLDHSPHTEILSLRQIRQLRKADKIEIDASKVTEYL